MKILSLDCSTNHASACLMDAGETVASTSWFEERARHEGLFEELSGLMKKTGWKWEDIELFTAGRGPGAYSGLRVSLLAVQSLAAPGAAPVMAVSSMEALAARLMRERGLGRITIVGDARRQSIWHGTCAAETIDSSPGAWRVTKRSEAEDVLKNAGPIASPHRTALRELLDTYDAVPGDQLPDARDVAALAVSRINHRVSSDPLTPLYLHPAV